MDQQVLFEDRFLESFVGSIVTDPAIAIVELVANCWDAYATEVKIGWPNRDQLYREYVVGGSAQHIAGRPIRALALWVARWVARQREHRLMHRKLLIPNEFLAMRPQYDIVLM